MVQFLDNWEQQRRRRGLASRRSNAGNGRRRRLHRHARLIRCIFGECMEGLEGLRWRNGPPSGDGQNGGSGRGEHRDEPRSCQNGMCGRQQHTHSTVGPVLAAIARHARGGRPDSAK